MITIVLLDTLIWPLWHMNQKKATQKLEWRMPMVMHLYFLPFGIIFFSVFAYFGSPLTSNYPLYITYILTLAFLVLFEMFFTYKVYKNLNTSWFFKLRTWVGLLISAIFDYFFLEHCLDDYL